MRTVHRHVDKLSECLSAVSVGDIRPVNTVPTMFAGQRSQTLAVQLVCTLHCRVANFEVHRRTGQPLLSDTVRIRRLKLFGHVAWADKSQDHSRALQACIYRLPQGTGGGVQVVQDTPG